jgi:transposase
LGRHRWVVERGFARTGNYRHLATRWEREASRFLGFLTLAATLICHKRYLKRTT